jgi:hypothetical protein
MNLLAIIFLGIMFVELLVKLLFKKNVKLVL